MLLPPQDKRAKLCLRAQDTQTQSIEMKGIRLVYYNHNNVIIIITFGNYEPKTTHVDAQIETFRHFAWSLHESRCVVSYLQNYF